MLTVSAQHQLPLHQSPTSPPVALSATLNQRRDELFDLGLDKAAMGVGMVEVAFDVHEVPARLNLRILVTANDSSVSSRTECGRSSASAWSRVWPPVFDVRQDS